jgi:hypothetical protein
MALFHPPSPAQLTGSENGLTFTHRGSVNVGRSRSMPIYPNTKNQVRTRTLMMPIARRWSSTLNTSQRTAWGTYAAASPIPGPWGGTKKISGYAMYFRCMRPRLNAGMTLLSAGPTTTGLPTYTQPTFGLLTGGGTLQVKFTATDTWATESGAGMFVFISRQKPSSRTHNPEDWKYAGVILGASGPAVNPAIFTLNPALVNPRNSIWFRVSVSRADGRLST